MLKFIPLFLLITLCRVATAQDEAITEQNSDTAQSGHVQIRALAFLLFQDIKHLELRVDGNQGGNLELSSSQLKKPISISTRGFSYGVSKNDEFQQLGSVNLPEAGDDFILFFTPTDTGYHAYIVRADDPNFQGGDTYLVNSTQYQIQAKLGTATHVIKTMQAASIRPVVPGGNPYYQAMFSYDKDGKSIPFSNTRWPVNASTKTLVFVFEDPSTGQIAYRSCTELAKP